MDIESIDRAEALQFLAYRGQELGEIEPLLSQCEELVLKAITPLFVYRYFPLEYVGETPVLCGIELVGKDIAGHLGGCGGAVLMCCTAGAGADRLIRALQAEDMTKAVIADAFAGAAVEKICEAAEKEAAERLSGKHFTWRFSPGYGDFPLEIQPKLLALLNAPQKIGVCATESLMMTPCKSVTAIIGVSDEPIEKGRRGCAVCNMKNSCEYRRRGTHCGY